MTYFVSSFFVDCRVSQTTTARTRPLLLLVAQLYMTGQDLDTATNTPTDSSTRDPGSESQHGTATNLADGKIIVTALLSLLSTLTNRTRPLLLLITQRNFGLESQHSLAAKLSDCQILNVVVLFFKSLDGLTFCTSLQSFSFCVSIA